MDDPPGDAIDSEAVPHAAGSTTRIKTYPFTEATVGAWRRQPGRHENWPVVYTLNDSREVYVGETLNAVNRIRQHLTSPAKKRLKTVRVIVDPTFNKSASLDLESFLIRMFSGDGRFCVLNGNHGVVDADYFQREMYQEKFEEIFEQLRAEGLFSRRIKEIRNSDLFKLSPFKALNTDQETIVEDILEGLFADLEHHRSSTAVIEGGPGTGKTIIAVYLLKLLVDIRDRAADVVTEGETLFEEFFTTGHPELLRDTRMGIVVPQQSLRASIKNVFRSVPGLSPTMVLTPYDVASSPERFDLLVVDETHRLTQWGAQAVGVLTKKFREHSKALARPGESWEDLTQIDWILRKSRHQIFLLDEAQAVRPNDVPNQVLVELRRRSQQADRRYRLHSQMRVQAGGDYIEYVRAVLSDDPPAGPARFDDYDLRFYDDLPKMYDAIRARDAEHGLSRLLAGYAWKWRSAKGTYDDDGAPVWDIVIDGLELRWNQRAVDWINSPTSVDEVGSIHTVQGYDLNFAGVIIGPDLRLDPASGKIVFSRDHYFDTKGKSNNNLRGIVYTDEDLLVMVRNIYSVLLTRGIRGTYVYVCDEALRERVRAYFQDPAGDLRSGI